MNNYFNNGMMNNMGGVNYPNNINGGMNNMLYNNNVQQNLGLGLLRNNNQQQEKQEETTTSISIDTLEFDGVLKTKLTTTICLSEIVSELFKAVFTDFEGCLILPNQAGGFDTTLYFCDRKIRDEKRTQALQPVVQQGNNLNMSQRLANFNKRNLNKTYELTKQAKDILSEFMILPRNNNKPNWKQSVIERVNGNYNGCEIFIQVNNLDIVKIINKIYGNKSKEGKKVAYNITLLNPIAGSVARINNMDMPTNYSISILQLDVVEMEKVAKSIGIVPTTNSIFMVR